MDHRQRTGYLVLAVVLGHVILISAQVNAGPRTSVLENVTFGVFAELQRWLTTSRDGITSVWSGYVGLRRLRTENDRLSDRVSELELALQRQRAIAQRAEGLERLLEMREAIALATTSARVVAADATPYFRTLTIDRGLDDGVRTDAAVLAPAGVVGRVVGAPSRRAARVQLIVDRNAAAGARLERNRASGVVVGTDDESTLRMDYVSNLEEVRVGDRVVTSGADGIYPDGFAIGTVTDVALGPGLYLVIEVEPIVEFSKLEEVLVVRNDQGAAPLATEDE